MEGIHVSPAAVEEERKCQSLDLNEPRNEEVFLAQLHWRSRLLNRGFQAKILQIIQQHEFPGHGEHAPRRLSSESLAAASGGRLHANLVVSQEAAVHIGRSSSALGSITWSMNTDDMFACDCIFADGSGMVEVHNAPIKT